MSVDRHYTVREPVLPLHSSPLQPVHAPGACDLPRPLSGIDKATYAALIILNFSAASRLPPFLSGCWLFGIQPSVGLLISSIVAL